MRPIWGWGGLLLLVSACSGGSPVQSSTDGLDRTGLVGTATLGPIQPVCQQNEPCDAPLQADFTLRRGGRAVAHFASDSSGHFLVYAPPGTYIVVPAQPIGLGVQTPEVTIQARGLTHIDLSFDTGIR